MVAGLATLQDGHACGGEQHGSRSNYGNRGTSRRHTITLVVLIILISVGHTRLLGAGLLLNLGGPKCLVKGILCGIDIGLLGILVVVHLLSGGNLALQSLPCLLGVLRLVSLLGLLDGSLERLLLHRFDGGLLFQGLDGLVQRSGRFLDGGLSDLTGLIALEHTFRSLDGLVQGLDTLIRVLAGSGLGLGRVDGRLQRGLLHVGGERNECLLAVLELGHLLGDLFFGGIDIVVHSLGSVNALLELSP